MKIYKEFHAIGVAILVSWRELEYLKRERLIWRSNALYVL